MSVTGVVARVRVDDLDAAIPTYEALTGRTAARFSFGSATLASVGCFLLFHADGADGDRLAGVRATLVTDDLDREIGGLAELGAEVVAPPARTPNGRRAIIRHPDGAVFEYVGG